MIAKKKRNLVLFVIMVILSGWIGVLVDQILTEQPEGNSLGMGLWLILPLLTAVIIRAKEHDWRSFGLALHMKSRWKWYIAALLIYPVITFVTIMLAVVFQCIEVTNFTSSTFFTLMIASLSGSFIKNVFEEFAWRGHLAPRLIECGFSDWKVYGVTGLIWGLWHSPYYLFFLEDRYFTTNSRLQMILIGCVVMILWSVLFVELYRITQSVWPCVILHSMEDAIPTVLVATGGFVKFKGLGEILLNPITGILSVVILTGFGLYIRKCRIKQCS